MGKFGAGELNYSSDIDLIVLFDPEIAPVAGDREAAVRLRPPDPAAGAHPPGTHGRRLCLPHRPAPSARSGVDATRHLDRGRASNTTKACGQNWERAALIKARPVAGDIAAGEAFLGELTPYIWRKYLDYAAIADIHSIKRQIHDFRGHEQIAVAGSQHQARPRRHPRDRVLRPDPATDCRRPPSRAARAQDPRHAGGARQRAAGSTGRRCDDLTEAYRYLREVEHRLQMIADEQTHTLPDDGEDLAVVARHGRLSQRRRISTRRCRASLDTVRGHYAILFERAPSLSAAIGNLVVHRRQRRSRDAGDARPPRLRQSIAK